MRLWHRLKGWRREAPAVGTPAEVGFETWYRLKGWQKLLLITLCVLAYVVCVAPTFTSNVLPHIMASVNADGSLNGGEIVQSVYLIGAVILLTMAPLLMLHVSWAQAAGLLVMSLFIVYVNINNATGTIGHTRDANADAPRQKIERIARLDSEIENGEKAYKQVPQHDYVLAATVKSAETAMATLKASADAECHSGTFGMTRGPRCSELERKRDAKAEEVERLQQNADLTQRATDIEVALAELRNERKTLGAVLSISTPRRSALWASCRFCISCQPIRRRRSAKTSPSSMRSPWN